MFGLNFINLTICLRIGYVVNFRAMLIAEIYHTLQIF